MKNIVATFVLLFSLMGVSAQTSFISENINYEIVSSNTVKVIANGHYSGNIAIPSNVSYAGKTYNVTAIGQFAFENCPNLTSISIPSSVTSIEAFSFAWCSGLTSLTIPSTVTFIGKCAFLSCYGLTSITIPSSVTSIGESAFDGCYGLTSLTLPSSVTSIGRSAFFGCYGLTSVTIPSSVTSIGRNAFSACHGLTSVTIPSSVTSISGYAFSHCSSLTTVYIQSQEITIDKSAFYYCANLKQFIVDDSNQHYTSLEGVLFNKTLDTLLLYPNGKSPSYTIPSSVKAIGPSAFEFCRNLTSITIPNSVVSIGEAAFMSCSGLTSINFSDGIASIESSAFLGCDYLTSITIPSSVTEIGEQSFRECIGLSEIHCQMNIPPVIKQNVFGSVDTIRCKLYVPKGSSGLYSEVVGWGDFADIIEETVTDVEELNSTPVSVYADQHEMVVKGARPGEMIYVYALTGELVKAVKATSEVRIQIPFNKVFLVKVAEQTFKVLL